MKSSDRDIPKSRKQAAEQKSVSRRSRYAKDPAINFKAASKIVNIAAAFIALFLIASLYTPWTGKIGASAAHCLLSAVGGSVVIPLIFMLYAAISLLFCGKLEKFFRQLCGTFFVFMLVSMLLGLNELSGGEELLAFSFAAAGKFGLGLSTAIYESTGVVGTFITGLLLIYFALVSYNIRVFTFIKLPKIAFGSLLPARRPKRENKPQLESGENDKDEDTYEDYEDTEEEPIGAPNISDYKSNQNYFDYNEENTECESSNDEQDGYLSENSADRNVPEYKANKADEDAASVIQDPNFSFENGSARGIKQGIFPPPIEIFGPVESREGEMDEERAEPLGQKIVKTLEQFGIESALAEILVGPTVIQFRIQLAPGIKVSKVAALSNDIALAMAVPSLRIEAPIPGKPYVGIEIPNPKRRGIPLRTVIEDDGFQDSDASLPLPFGVAVNGDSVIVGLEELPHLLVAGTTGSGKSVFVNSCIVGLCSKRRPEELRMILVDPKRVEMAVYDKLPHLLTPPVTDPKKAVQALAWLIREMESRYSTFAKLRVRNLDGYNAKVLPKDKLPHIVIVVDELADLMMTAAKEVEEYICRLAQMARATGIHLMLATQRPSVNIITGLIKANIPARVAFTLPSNADSRTIIDCAGAEKLLGKGDMLFLSTKYPKPVRIQAPWIDEKILADWLKYISNTFGEPDFIEIEAQGAGPGGSGNDGTFDDEMLEEAVEMVLSTGIASASGLQRRLRIGFSRASRLIDMMEQLGIVGPADGARPRDILVDEDTARELMEDAIGK